MKRRENFDVIFADPDYNIGIKYEDGKKMKMPFEDYINWCSLWAVEAYDPLLKVEGNMFIINYPRNNAYLRVLTLDDRVKRIGGRIHEYVWVYNTNVGVSNRHFTRAHRTILHLTKSKHNNWYRDRVAEPYLNPEDKRIKKLYAQGSKGRMPYSWTFEQQVKNVEKKDIGHPCILPPELTLKYFKASTQPGDTALVLFAGSGNDMISALNAGCSRVVGIELNKEYCKLIERRMEELGAEKAKG